MTEEAKSETLLVETLILRSLQEIQSRGNCDRSFERPASENDSLSLEEQFARLEAHLQQLEALADELDEKLDELDKDVSDLNDAVDELAEDVSRIEAKVSKLKAIAYRWLWISIGGLVLMVLSSMATALAPSP